ncbi:MAG: T9SS type A sorting domain-containing protein [Bacteroidetes bacterium]|nr:T9SS type A sorting domain-containing protein [Bacteroidota bacterium]
MDSGVNFVCYFDTANATSLFNVPKLDALPEESLADRLQQYLRILHPQSSLNLMSNVRSLTSTHLSYNQTINGIEIYRAQVKVNISSSNKITSLFDNSIKEIRIAPNKFPVNYTFPASYRTNGASKQVYFYSAERILEPCMLIHCKGSGDENWELIIDSNNKILYQRDLNVYYKPLADSVVKAMVYMPDPLTSGNVVYGGSYKDNNDADSPQLTNQRTQVDIKVDYSGGLFSLENNYVSIQDFSSPFYAPATSFGIPDFDFTRSQSEFEDVNVYYHINTYQNYLQQLGFFNLVNYPIAVDPHGTFNDNSFFTPSSGPPSLTFGVGGVDDAEDADVIVHEYGHAVSYSAAPNTNFGNQRMALDEAIGDYIAASYSRSINEYKWEDVYTWDGHNEFWSGRKTTSEKQYPNDLDYNIYHDAEIWSSTIMQIWEDIGRETTDRILFESLYNYSSGMTMKDAAILFAQADSLLNGGANAASICKRMYERGLFDICYVAPNDGNFIHVLNSIGFSDGTGLQVLFADITDAKISLYNTLGKNLYSHNLQAVGSFSLDGRNFAKGIYLLDIETTSQRKVFKLINQ